MDITIITDSVKMSEELFIITEEGVNLDDGN